MDYRKLISGSDIRGIYNENLNEQFLNDFINSLSYHLLQKTPQPKVIIGKDSRSSGETIEKWVIRGLTNNGIDVIKLVTEQEWKNVSTTPMIFCAIRHYQSDAGIMITASHLPQQWNGLKIFEKEDTLPKSALKEIVQKAQEQVHPKKNNTGTVTDEKYVDIYSNDIIKMIRDGIQSQDDYAQPLNGLNILVDSGNGATGFFASKILRPLGANTQGSLYLEPDGTFPNHVPNPEEPDAVKDLCAAVKEKKAALGIIFDTDGDRSSVVLPNGTPAIQNRLLALVSAMVLEEHPGSKIVTDSVTSDGLTDFISLHKGIHHRFKRGYANVRNEMRKINADKTVCYTGGETSGHIMFTENHYADDGSYTVARLLIYLANLQKKNKDFLQLLSGLKEPVESKSYRLKILLEDFREYGENVIRHFIDWSRKNQYEIDTTEGVRISFKSPEMDGWALVRLSLHEPLLVVNLESNVEKGFDKIKDIIKSNLLQFEKISMEKM